MMGIRSRTSLSSVASEAPARCLLHCLSGTFLFNLNSPSYCVMSWSIFLFDSTAAMVLSRFVLPSLRYFLLFSEYSFCVAEWFSMSRGLFFSAPELFSVSRKLVLCAP
jgi:hypothetical protein